MSESADIEFSAIEGFARSAGPGQAPPLVFGSPQRYVQGEGVIDQAGHYLSRLGMRNVAILCSARSQTCQSTNQTVAKTGACC